MDIPTGPYLDPIRQDVHIIKCVVVGDTGVGKTRLICARACETRYTLQQLTQTHVPTVWAIDHYRKDREVLEKSWCTIDGVSVSLRLWDTFGYHDKDRRFAYGRADVILICYSVVRPRSLRNILQHWVPEVRRFCPDVPMIICGCQIDLRYLYLDDSFINIEKGPFFREIFESDILTPEQGRAVAREIDAAYYETSVLVPHGIDDVFTNVMRAALASKRDRNFWNILGQLKRISRPICQAPLLPPRAPAPKIEVPPPCLDSDLETLLNNQAFCDVIFVARGVCIQAHKVCLVAASTIFEDLFLSDLSSPVENIKPTTCCPKLQRTSSKNSSSSQKNGAIDKEKQSDTAKLLENDEIDSSSILELELTVDEAGCLPQFPLNHQAFTSIQLQQCDDVFSPGTKVIQTVITLNEDITPSAFQYILQYLYTGKCGGNCERLADVRRAADMVGCHDLVYMVTNLLNKEEYLNPEVELRFQNQRCQRLRELMIKRGLLSDVIFQVDDGQIAAHKALLMPRCDVMLGMFSYNFKESSAKLVPFPGVAKDTFMALQEYLYTGQCPVLSDIDCIELIELANRLCLPRLLALTELYIVCELTQYDEVGKDVVEDVLTLLEPSQLHNAKQLADWCLWFLASNYKVTYRKYGKLVQTLRPENQVFLSKHRWPPIWYLKDMEHYEKCMVDMERERSLKPYGRRNSDDCTESGCLGFCGRTRRKLRCQPVSTSIVS